MNLSELQSDDITKIALVVIGALVLIGALLSLIITKLVGRIIVMIVVVVLGGFVWNQHKTIQDKIQNCDLNLSFFGVDVKVPPSVEKQCKEIVKQSSAKS